MKADTMRATPVKVREREKTGFLPQRSMSNILKEKTEVNQQHLKIA